MPQIPYWKILRSAQNDKRFDEFGVWSYRTQRYTLCSLLHSIKEHAIYIFRLSLVKMPLKTYQSVLLLP
jgi:hypothetical protein